VSARATPYPPPGYELRIPASIWEGALATVREYARLGSEQGRRGSEALVYLGGVVAGEQLIITGLHRLGHVAQGDRVVVSQDEARWLLRSLRSRDEKLIGQLHSHRGLAGHSPGDDMWATSFHEGFLSIVVPHFGAVVAVPGECAVLEYRDGHFQQLERSEVERRVCVCPEITERPCTSTSEAREEVGWWRAFAARVRSTARRSR
jgi:hypothetical protein